MGFDTGSFPQTRSRDRGSSAGRAKAAKTLRLAAGMKGESMTAARRTPSAAA